MKVEQRGTVGIEKQYSMAQRNSEYRGYDPLEGQGLVLSIIFPLNHSAASIYCVYWLCILESFQEKELTEMKHYTNG